METINQSRVVKKVLIDVEFFRYFSYLIGRARGLYIAWRTNALLLSLKYLTLFIDASILDASSRLAWDVLFIHIRSEEDVMRA